MPLTLEDPTTIRPQLTSSPSTASRVIRQFLSRTRSTEPDQTEDDRLVKRRATNRKSQQKSRENKDALIKQLQDENKRLRREIDTRATPQARGEVSGEAGHGGALLANESLSGTTALGSSDRPSDHTDSPFSPSAFAWTWPLPEPNISSPESGTGLAISSIDLDACRQAFLAVLASVCDPHLNTIHAVCAKFSQSRGANVHARDLQPPRPVNRPLNVWDARHSEPHHGQTVSPFGFSPDPLLFGNPLEQEDSIFASLFSDSTPCVPASDFVPSLGTAGPLSVPFLEPAHPVNGLELDAGDVWSLIMVNLDMSRVDAEGLASRLTEKVRCYGFGPVLVKQDVADVCNGLPRLRFQKPLSANVP